MKLRYTRAAVADVAAILDYLAARSPQAATRVGARLDEIIKRLVNFPDLGTRTEHPLIRRITVTPYPFLIFYRPTSTEIIILGVRHAARDPGGMPGAR